MAETEVRLDRSVGCDSVSGGGATTCVELGARAVVQMSLDKLWLTFTWSLK